MKSQEHPRARGENPRNNWSLRSVNGTSPRTRGKLLVIFFTLPATGNIPAHAGKTSWECGLCSPPPEHPRARGENRLSLSGFILLGGTSPRTRGKQFPGAQKIIHFRNIPAHAGKPPKSRPHNRRVGNIPAHAGKTTRKSAWVSLHSEHPRARGENVRKRKKKPATIGTSPRTRGKPVPRDEKLIDIRNIPAHAGKTKGSGVDFLNITGTSPRTRGKLSAKPCSAS